MSLGEFFTLLGYLVGAGVLWLEAKRLNLQTEGMRQVALAGLAGGVIGAKVIQWAMDGALWTHPFAMLDPRYGGKALLGGIFGGWLAVELTKRRLGIKRRTGDMWALAIPAGEAVGRIGCWLNGCCFGAVCSADFALKTWQHSAWRYPTQLYSAIFSAALFALLWSMRKRTAREGDLWSLFLVFYGIGRFMIEFWRERPLTWGPLSTVQLICLETVALTVGIWWWTQRRNRVQAAVTGNSV